MHRDRIRELLSEQGCPIEEADLKDIESALAHLNTLPEIEPSRDTWKKIEANLPARQGARVYRFWLRAAAAASVMLAALTFAVVVNTPRTGGLPVVVETGKPLSSWNDRYIAEQFSTLRIDDVGLLKLNKNAILRFENPRCVVLESGEVFAEIKPSGKGFEIRSGESTVRVKGTKFGVTAPSTVYVVEGAVEVSSPRGQLHLGPRQASVESRLVDLGAEDHLRWLAQYERPSVRLKLDPRDQTTITPGAPLKWNLILETDALAPLTLGKPRDVSQFFSLIVNDVGRPLDATRVTVKDARSGPAGIIRMDVAHPCILECAVDPGLFHEKGKAWVSVVFTSGAPGAESAWEGSARSQAIPVEVR
ncbi:MAG: FecR domain-containing protein [Planctomycetaceae bacterium]|nr:FecR domain-containing protein [Planctomycetaceae bacterium]